ncbi:NAD(P)H-binding protein [Streptomyces boncukensis]|uniref:NAD(P)H-binding protein n=1 Tax=Streptomyces boncukensis TaxID=2711219 RepID=A0A6G4WRU1_9ACTN|nr:NAD(P)H-binding protein [Streptomyces boncukensis]NGO67986.1 NAD(P)H-binding protein [Streptomyces boncukensis]
MTDAPILVLGGTGKTGRRVAAALAERGHTPRAASRSGDVRFDWTDPATWEPALEGVRAVYVVDSQTPGAAREVPDFSALAVARGVERLVLLSARAFAELDALGAPDELLAPERAVRESGAAWTVLRPTWFSQNFTEFPVVSDGIARGELRLPVGDGPESFVDVRDVAEVAVEALTGEGHAGETYELSGPRALTWAEAVGELARATGRPLRYTPLSEAEYRRELAAEGWPEEAVEVLSALFGHIREGRSGAVSDGVRRALGREPRGFADYAADYAAESAADCAAEAAARSASAPQR